METMERVNEINEISSILENSQDKLNSILSKLGWNQEVLQKEPTIKCSVNKGHTMPASSIQQHVNKCKLASEDPKDVCPSSHFFYKNSLAVVPVIIDKKKYESFKQSNQESVSSQETKPFVKHWQCLPTDLDDGCHKEDPKDVLRTNIQNTPANSKVKGVQERLPSDVPFTMPAVRCELNPAQRGQMYDYVVETAKNIKRRAIEDEMDDLEHLAENADKDRQDEPKSHYEALAQMRDYKRRRQSYRAKNVHMTKRSRVDVMRDLIETQMKMLQEQYNEEIALDDKHRNYSDDHH